MKTVFITGANTGIGLATARHLHQLGWHVYAGIYPNEDTTALKNDSDERLNLIPLDITRPEMIQSALAQISKEQSHLDALVNNAGIAISGPIEVLPLDDIRRQFEVNFIGQIAMTQAMLPLIRKAKGRIVNVASILGRIVSPYSIPYCASKFAMQALTDGLRLELHPWGIEVVAIEPTLIQTAIWQKQHEWQEVLRAELPAEARELYLQRLETFAIASKQQQSLGASPDVVAEAIGKALTAKKPKTRYTVGPDAFVLNLLWRIVPDRLRDEILLRRLRML